MPTKLEYPAPKVSTVKAQPKTCRPVKSHLTVIVAPSEKQTSVRSRLHELIRLRVAQINQCSEPVQYHLGQLRANGETASRLEELPHWQTANCFDPRERAALRLCENFGLDHSEKPSKRLLTELKHYFTKNEIVELVIAIIGVNEWILLHDR